MVWLVGREDRETARKGWEAGRESREANKMFQRQETKVGRQEEMVEK